MKTKIIFSLLLNLIILMPVFAQWQQCGSYTGNVLPFAVKDTMLVAGTYGSGAYLTSDGINWSFSASGMTNTQIISLTLSGGFLFAGSETGGIYRSSDNGGSWTPVNNGLSNFAIHALSSNDGKIFAGTSAGICRSTDNGNNWSRISFSPVGNVIYSLESFGNSVMAGTSTGVYFSSDNGGNWQNVNSGISGAVYCLLKIGNEIFAGTSSSGIYKTTDNGGVWMNINSGLPASPVRGLFALNQKIFAATYGGGFYYSTNGGANWLPSITGLTQLVCYSVISFGNYIYCSTTSGIFRRSITEFTGVSGYGKKNTAGNYHLSENYPNPFNPVTVIDFYIPENNFIMLEIYDVLGREIQTLVSANLKKGNYSVNFSGSGLHSGVYFYRLTSENYSCVKKMILIK